MVEEQALVVIEVGGIRAPAVKVPRELQHVVGTATFGSIGAQLPLRSEPSGRGQPGFGVARAAGDIRARRADLVEEVVGDIVEPGVAGDLVTARCGDGLRNVCVDVQAAKLVAVQGERVDEAPFLKPIAHPGNAIVLRLRR